MNCRIGIILIIVLLVAGCNMPLPASDTPQATQGIAEQTPNGVLTTNAPISITLTVPATEPIGPAPTLEESSETPEVLPAATAEQRAENEPTAANPAGAAQADETGFEIDARFQIQPGTPTYMGNFLEPTAGCNWMGVAGQVFGVDGKPITQIIVEVSGELGGKSVMALGLTGAAQTLGPGGYLIHLSDLPIDSQGQLSVMVRSLGGTALSTPVSIDTFGGCEKNMILVNFIPDQTLAPGDEREYLPFISGQPGE